MRSPKEVEKEEYNKFYKSAFKGEFMDPMAYTHFITEVGGWGMGWEARGMEGHACLNRERSLFAEKSSCWKCESPNHEP